MQTQSREQLIAARKAATADFEAQLLGKRENTPNVYHNPDNINKKQKIKISKIKELDPQIEEQIPDRLKKVDRNLLKTLGLLPKNEDTSNNGQKSKNSTLNLCKRIPLNSDTLVESLAPTPISYSKNPLSKFGENALKSMGWSEGKIIGQNQSSKQYKQQKNKLLKPIQFVSRPRGLGLGSVPKKEILDMIRDGKIIDQNALVAKAKKGYVLLGEGEDSNVINTGETEDNLTKFGSKVSIIGGKYKDLVGLLKGVDEDSETAILELALNGMTVNIPLKYVRKYKGNSAPKVKKAKKKKSKKEKSKALKWIVPGIQLKIVSKKYKDGKFFLKQGQVSDILTPEIFVFVTDDKIYIEDLREKHMETVMPKIGQTVKILKGEHKGKNGILHSRKKKENVVEIQLDQEGLIVKMSQDDCSALALGGY